jgi:hypothetical protein
MQKTNAERRTISNLKLGKQKAEISNQKLKAEIEKVEITNPKAETLTS